jgi:hypothetical protein
MAKNGGPSKQQFHNWESMQRTRENASEFAGAASVAGLLYRNIDLDLRQKLRKTYLMLVSDIRSLQLTDTINNRGERYILLTDVDMNFNNIVQGQNLSGHDPGLVNSAGYSEDKDRSTGIVSLTFYNGIMASDLTPPQNSTSYTVEIYSIVVSNFYYDEQINCYYSVTGMNFNKRLSSGFVDVGVDTPVPFSLTQSLGFVPENNETWLTDYIIRFWTHLGPHNYLQNGPSYDVILSSF